MVMHRIGAALALTLAGGMSAETGLHIQGASVGNQILNLDSYLNRDPRKNGESADGLAIKEGSGTGNVVRGARLWNNVDDGFDAWEFTSPITVEGLQQVPADRELRHRQRRRGGARLVHGRRQLVELVPGARTGRHRRVRPHRPAQRRRLDPDVAVPAPVEQRRLRRPHLTAWGFPARSAPEIPTRPSDRRAGRSGGGAG
jgi:hypothetical protein